MSVAGPHSALNMVALSNAEVAAVTQLVMEAGLLALNTRKSVAVEHKSDPRDLVTSADIACSALIVGRLRDLFPFDTIVSEEDAHGSQNINQGRTWQIDPIDGTENYVANDGMYSVMVGLLIDGQPAYGWVYEPQSDGLYVAYPNKKLIKTSRGEQFEISGPHGALNEKRVRLMMGNRDREQHPWVDKVMGVEFITSGSVGLRVAMIAEGKADVYLHLAGKLKTWDTAAPVAIANAVGLDIGSIDFDGIRYENDSECMHRFPIAIGVPGALNWVRSQVYPRRPNH